MERKRGADKPAARIALLGILAALAIALSALEGLLPVIPVPGAKWGLSNLATMTALSLLGWPAALGVTLAKAGFTLLRGGTACLMSLSGGLFSLLVMTALFGFMRGRVGYLGVGVAGAAAHNAGQLLCAMALVDGSLWRLAPFLLLAALATGCATGLIMQAVWPALKRLYKTGEV